MDICHAKFSAGNVLSEQVARQVFESLPEQGVIAAIVGPDGSCWQSDSEEFTRLGLNETTMAELRARVDDGVEPVTARVGDASIAMAPLTGEHANLGYAIVAVAHSAAKSLASDAALLEALLGQISLVAKLIEKNGLLVAAQVGYVKGLEAGQNSLN
jgi:hypothetical protein